jgi:RNA recognition motif-containing protein
MLQLSEAELLQMFSGFGTVTKLAMAGDTTVHQARFAFVEFSTVAEAHMALAMNGTIVGERYLSHSSAASSSSSSSPVAHASESRRAGPFV